MVATRNCAPDIAILVRAVNERAEDRLRAIDWIRAWVDGASHVERRSPVEILFRVVHNVVEEAM